MGPRTMKFFGVVLSAAMLLSWFPFETRSASADQTRFYNLVNDLLQKAGGTHALVMDERLNQSATNHTNYMALNEILTHAEVPGRPGFTGVSPSARATYTGFPYTAEVENATMGADPGLNLKSWLDSLPHRANLISDCNLYVGYGNNKSSYPTGVFQGSCGPSWSGEKIVTKYPYPGQIGVPVTRDSGGYATTALFHQNHYLYSGSFKDSSGVAVPLLEGNDCEKPNAGNNLTQYDLCPASPLKYGETYTVKFTGIWFLDGDAYEDYDISWSFTTETKDFSLSKNSQSNVVLAGGKATYNLAVNPVNAPTYPVALSVTGLPAGATASFSANNRVPYFASALSVQTSANSPPGTYPLTLKGVGGGITHTLPLSLIIRPKSVLTISASPVQIVYGKTTILSRVLSAGTEKLAGKNITVQSQGINRVWGNAGVVKTDAEGKWSFTSKPSRNVNYRAVFSGGGGHGAVTSIVRLVKVSPYVGISVKYPKIKAGHSDLMRFSTSPKHARYYLSIQKKVGTKWVTFGRVKLNSKGYGSYYFRTSRRGTYSVRAVLPRHSYHEAGVSKILSIKVY